ncbi:hypothetical protein ACFQAT_29080 [Undibacterium arcticum]|uniref:Uncharacterized protein n=1 Tax=Undibacterium arcticum TaxID=1762892 RepID=A0ABV7F6X5_9BURK
MEKWQASPLWPVVAEHATSIVNKRLYSNFCPEVSFDVFHLFASSLSRYADEIDRDAAERAMVREGSSGTNDWRWNWSHVSEMHYSECPLYSQLVHQTSQPSHQTPTKPGEKPTEILTLKPGAFGMSIDIKGLFTRVVRWWLSRNGKSG